MRGDIIALYKHLKGCQLESHKYSGKGPSPNIRGSKLGQVCGEFWLTNEFVPILKHVTPVLAEIFSKYFLFKYYYADI